MEHPATVFVIIKLSKLREEWSQRNAPARFRDKLLGT